MHSEAEVAPSSLRRDSPLAKTVISTSVTCPAAATAETRPPPTLQSLVLNTSDIFSLVLEIFLATLYCLETHMSVVKVQLTLEQHVG